MSNVTATIVVSFSDASNGTGILTAELDSRPDGYNAGKSTFSEGDEPVILVRKGSNVTIDQVITSVGSCGSFASGSTVEEEFLTYVQAAQATAGKPISNGFSSTWYGANLGSIVVKNDNLVEIAAPLPVTGVGVLGITYNSNFTAYRLTGVPSTLNGKKKFNVLIAFIGTAA